MTRLSGMTRALGWVGMLVAVAAGCTAGGDAEAQVVGRVERSARTPALGTVPTVIDTITPAKLSATFRAASDRALPAVVAIRVEQQASPAPKNHPPIPEEFRRFFPDGVPQPDEPSEGSGSGFIIDERGYIVTNRHVVQNASEVKVTLLDGRQFRAEVVGTDATTDVGVIKIDPKGEKLPTATLGDSDQLMVGDWVLALGNPMGLNFTVTAGIVSAESRSIRILEREAGNRALESFIQTDAAINPGNSGGPLVDLFGRVVGVNSAIQSPTGWYSGYGFAIPVNLVRRVVGDLVEYGAFRRPRLGVSVQTVSEADAELYGLASIAGAEISSVEASGAGAKAGLKMGDVVVGIEGEPVRTSTDFTARLARFHPGERVTLDVVRYGRRLRVPVELGEFAAEKRERVAQAAARPERLLGFSVGPLTPQIAAAAHTRTGVQVTDVDRLSNAYEAGVGTNLVIIRVNGQDVGNVGEFRRAADRVKPGQVVSMVVRLPIGDDTDAGPSETILNFRAER